jgi:thioredoxin reductase (NADPH)
MMYDLAIIGGGPVGLAAAIEAKRLGLSYVILEKGCVANSIFEFPTYLTFFTTSDRLEIGDHPMVTRIEKPDRREAMTYYRLVADREKLHVRQYTEVTAIHPAPAGFTLSIEAKTGEMGVVEARTVVVATGYWDWPNRLGIPGDDLENVSYRYGEPHPFWNLNVTVIGGGNSAAEAALDLYRAGAKVSIVHRGAALRPGVKYWLKPDIENRIREGSIRFYPSSTVREITPGMVVADGPDGTLELPTDFTFVLVGYKPDTDMLEASGVRVDGDGRVLHNAETFETLHRPGLFVVGSAAFGRFTGQVFIENGREHAFQAVHEIQRQLAAREAALSS